MQRPPATTGLRHVALWVQAFDACETFYVSLLGMQVEWRPDPDNVYLTSGHDNLALHRAPADFKADQYQRLDHIGFLINHLSDVDVWYDFLLENKVKMKTKPRTHRDGARSFYCYDPDLNTIQMIYHVPLVMPELT